MASSGVADLTGRVLAGRYRLLAPIGAGASGRVYMADDVRLKRRVAVKVLHVALAEDAGFLRRFRAEAQVAAALNHPNVMAVYDWGEDDVPFMVLELLSGGSLRGMLDAEVRLTPSQATHVGRQVTGALEYAHARGVVHRDIKPANLLFDEHGIVRVADFGLARALAEASWTEPAGAVVGTARYAAPEQASGAALDGRADLYSLAVVLIEAVTGSVPAVGDTAIGTLAVRTRTALVAPLALGRLGPVVERAGRPDPAERYPDAATMRSALGDAGRALPPPQPLTLAGLGGEIDGGPPTQIGRSASSTALFDQDAPVAPSEVLDDTAAAAPTAPAPVTLQHRRRAPGAVRWISFAVLAAILLAVVGGGIALAAVSSGGPTVAVPSLVGLTTQQATDAITSAGLTLRIVTRSTDDPKDTVVAQDPAQGAFAHDDDAVEIVVSRGPPPVAVPAVQGSDPAAAQAKLEAAGFVVDVKHQFDESVAAGAVIGTDPAAGASAPRFTTIVLKVSDGPAPVTVPDVSKKTFDEASQALTAAGFTVTRVDDFNATVASGSVIGTDPPGGQTARRGSTITVHVSKGPEMVTVPNLVGQTLEAAQQRLQSLGFEVDTQSYLPGRTVRAMSPAANTSVPKGTKITLFF